MIDEPACGRPGHGRSPSLEPCRRGAIWRERFGRLGLDAALAPAIDLAERGLACSARIADKWARAPNAHHGRHPRSGGRYRVPGLERTLRLIADHGPDALYRGELATAIAGVTWLSEADLAAHRSEWVEPLRLDYRGVEVCELPPNGQGVAALLALALYDGLEPGLHMQIEAMKLALSRDAHAVVHDGPLPAEFLAPGRLAQLRTGLRADAAVEPPPYGAPRGGTTYLCVGRRRWHCRLPHPEHLRELRLRSRPGRHGHRPSQPRGLLRRGSEPPQRTRTVEAARSTRSSRACCSKTASSWGRSA